MSNSVPEPLDTPISVTTPSFAGYASEEGIEGVGFWPRAAARVIDFIVHYIIGVCAGFLFGIILVIAAELSGHRGPFTVDPNSGLTLFIFALLGSVAYHTICEGMNGSTVGKRLLSLVVLQEDGSPCRFNSALIRSFAYFVDALFFGVIAYFAMQKSRQQQRHGDAWAHTVVCRRSQVAPEKLRGRGQFVLACLLGTMVDAALLMVGLLLRFT
jgi:uncharacterized RDD family membrane protein YckC